jgi:Lyase
VTVIAPTANRLDQTATIATGDHGMCEFRKETDSLGEVAFPADKLWGAQTQRSLEHFSIGKDLIPREMITAYAILKKAGANANHVGKRLDDTAYALIVQVADENPYGQTPQHVPVARVDDRQRHAVQHERQQGLLEPRLSDRRHAARQQDAGTSERPRQHVAVVEQTDHDLTLEAAALELGFVSEAEFDRIVDPAKMVRPYVATGS